MTTSKDIFFAANSGIFTRKNQAFMKLAFRELGLSVPESIVFIHVCNNPGIIQDEIATQLAYDNAVVTRCLKQLESKALVDRIVDKDNQRKKCVYPGSKARETKQKIDVALTCWDKYAFEGFSKKEQNQMIDDLRRLKNASLKIDIKQVLSDTKERWEK